MPFFVLRASAQPKDVLGWDNTKWGMTVEELQYIIGKDLKKRNPRHDELDNMYSGLQLRQIIIGQSEFRASFWMNEDSDKLKRIVFVPEGVPKKYEWAETFIELEKYLVSKYGNPQLQKTSNDPGTSADRKWMFPSTEIELSYLSIDGSELLLLVFSETEQVSE